MSPRQVSPVLVRSIFAVTATALVVSFVVLSSLAKGDAGSGLQGKARQLFPALPKDAGTAERPATPERVRLGRMLFFDPRISADGAVSCSRCHLPGFYGTDALPTSIGARDRKLTRNAPTVFNAALHSTQHWDGRFVDVEDQAEHGLTGPGLGNSDNQSVEARLEAIPGYPEAFRDAFPGNEKPITARNLALAIGAFERTLIAPSPFDEYLAGKLDALNDGERKGLRLFIETGCADCHKGPGVGGIGFRKFGMYSDYRVATGTKNPDKGRFDLTKNPDDVDKFKVPGLRNVAKTPPYFHDGSVDSLSKAIRIMAKTQLDTDLTDAEVEAIAAFLGSLTGPVPANYDPTPLLPPGGFRDIGPGASR